MFVCSQSVSGSAVLGTYLASVPWCFHVGRLDVFKNVSLHFRLPPTEHALPLTIQTSLHLWLDISVQVWWIRRRMLNPIYGFWKCAILEHFLSGRIFGSRDKWTQQWKYGDSLRGLGTLSCTSRSSHTHNSCISHLQSCKSSLLWHHSGLKITTQFQSFLCFLSMCIFKAWRVGLKALQTRHWNTPLSMCFASMWFLVLLLRLDEKSHWEQVQLPVSSLRIFCSINSSKPTNESFAYQNIYFNAILQCASLGTRELH